jgi:hypothetical protein
MDFCSFLPPPGDLWNKPHIYGYVGLFIGAAIGVFGPINARFGAAVNAIFGTGPGSARLIGATFAFLGVMTGQVVALLVSVSCKG